MRCSRSVGRLLWCSLRIHGGSGMWVRAYASRRAPGLAACSPPVPPIPGTGCDSGCGGPAVRAPVGGPTALVRWPTPRAAPRAPLLRSTPTANRSRGVPCQGNAILAFGTERDGLSEELLAAADARVSLPMEPGVSSLNLATSVAATLYAWRLARLAIRPHAAAAQPTGMGWPWSAASTLRAQRSVIASRAACVADPMCGRTIRFGAPSNGIVGGSGSGSVTSRAAAPAVRAPAQRAARPDRPSCPRAVFTRIAPGRMM